jgi:hypothetical protein
MRKTREALASRFPRWFQSYKLFRPLEVDPANAVATGFFVVSLDGTRPLHIPAIMDRGEVLLDTVYDPAEDQFYPLTERWRDVLSGMSTTIGGASTRPPTIQADPSVRSIVNPPMTYGV